MSPLPSGLALNINEADNALDLELPLAVAPYIRVDAETASEIIARGKATVRQWPKIAGRLGIPDREQERMAPAFRLAGP